MRFVDLVRFAVAAATATVLAVTSISSSVAEPEPTLELVLTGQVRPPTVPAHWVGSPTRSAPGWRWDDPANEGNSVRIFRADPGNADVSKRVPYVIVVSNGQVLGNDGQPIAGAVPAD